MSTLKNRNKFGPQQSGMTHQRWCEVSLMKKLPKMIHVSKELPYEMPDPRAGTKGFPAVMPMMKITPGGVTYRAGRNIAKGARREIRIRSAVRESA